MHRKKRLSATSVSWYHKLNSLWDFLLYTLLKIRPSKVSVQEEKAEERCSTVVTLASAPCFQNKSAKLLLRDSHYKSVRFCSSGLTHTALEQV